MTKHSSGARMLLIILTALLALPITHTASPVEAKKRLRTATRVFNSDGSWNVGQSDISPLSATPYPFIVEVSGLKGSIRDVNATLLFVNHDNPDDLEVLLVGPRGQSTILMADVGGETDIDSVTLTFDDEAPASLPDNGPLQIGAYRPANAEGNLIAFNAPAPAATANAALSVFDGSNPNGTWRLFIQDDVAATNPGYSANGWVLEITTAFKVKQKNKSKQKSKARNNKRKAQHTRESSQRPAAYAQLPMAVS